ncbi:site-2 protease family protein [Marinactinospora thermotolerans]|uniref:Zinc metalloprotease n=1 Tax=Marinactinospora thermotolerans DSM 45154 TaxID=1122192 RepID=A0A1T4T641_9ACTN|nr:site-2 protease family protein [Marinactinospora thermotolerans]SKA35916.1 Zn-dependent protease (includes SpoIVFB) [Marinactinospora thermotolerans DSM 45154]
MGSPFGIPVHVAPSWLIIAAIITVLYAPLVEGRLALGPLSYLVAFVFAVLLYASVLVHELAHSVVARRYGLPVRRITLYMLGGVSEIEREAPTPGREFWVAFSGPLLSLVLAAGGLVAYGFADPDTIVGVLLWQLWVANLLVGVFNLLPGLPLDGGRLLRALVWGVTRRPYAGTLAAAWVGRALAAAVIALPFLSAWWTAGSPNLFAILWAVLLGGFIWSGATSSLRAARLRERLPGLRARSLAREAILLTADTSVAEGLRRMDEAGAEAIVVIDTDDTPTSIVSDAAIAAIPEARRPWVPLSSAARAILPGGVLDAGLEGVELLEALHAHPAQEYLLTGSGGRVEGVLRSSDVQAAVTGS